MIDRIPILVAGYPKSGTTWLTRLLGDALDSPTGGSCPSEDAREVATEGQDRPGPYVVRKGHYRLSGDDFGPALPGPHRLVWRRLSGEKVVFIVRDPRDVCVSGAHYWRTTPEDFLNRMIAGRVAKLPRWDRYVEGWLTLRFPFIRYEDLLKDTEKALSSLLALLKVNCDESRLPDVVHRQSFIARLNAYDGMHPEQHRRIMRQGTAGQWHEAFNQRMGHMCQTHFGATMARLGYIKDIDWWKRLPN